jgi:hypothetical protein
LGKLETPFLRRTPRLSKCESLGEVGICIGAAQHVAEHVGVGEVLDDVAGAGKNHGRTNDGGGGSEGSGKIDVMGPDAGPFPDRFYINSFSTLGVGRARYGIMPREDCLIMDDGTTSRLADDHYFVTTTTGKAAALMQHLEFCRQVLWPELDSSSPPQPISGPSSLWPVRRLALC